MIVGRADGTVVQAPEPACVRDWPKYGFPKGTYGPLPKEMEAKANEQLDNFAKLLEGRGIKVDRPTPIDFTQKVQTPDWVQNSMFGVMPPRDLLATVGNEILEATMSQRSRWFEFICYRPLLNRYFQEDPNFRFEAAPKPRLTDRTYKIGFWDEVETKTEEEQIEQYTMNKQWALTEEEPLFDAADIGRFGKDLFVQRSTCTNASGMSWLRRHFPNHRIHEVMFKEAHPMHIDATFVPVRPGIGDQQPAARSAHQGDGRSVQDERLGNRRMCRAGPQRKGTALLLQRLALHEYPGARSEDDLRGGFRNRPDGTIRRARVQCHSGSLLGRVGIRRRAALRHRRCLSRGEAGGLFPQANCRLLTLNTVN